MASSRGRDVAVDLFLEVAEAAIHAILCVRKVYPRSTFERRLLYGAPIHMNRHPELCQYISSVLANARPLLLSGEAEKLVVSLHQEGSDGAGSEAYIFEAARFGSESQQGMGADEDTLLFDAEAQLRDLLLRTMALEWQLAPLPENCRFSLLVHSKGGTSGEGTRAALETGSWLLAMGSESARMVQCGEVSPLRTIDTLGLRFQVFASKW